MYSVIKRDGKVVDFNLNKIKNAIVSAFDACEKEYHPDGIDFLVLKVMSDFEKKIKELYGIEVQVANADDSALADNSITLVAAGK